MDITWAYFLQVFPNFQNLPDENIKHIYNCELLSEKKEQGLDYEKIFNGTINQQIDVFRIVKQNLDQRELIISEMNSPCDPCDPLYSVMD